MTVDVWMQHPTLRFLNHDMFESLRRWTGQEIPSQEVPIEMTLAAMDAAGVHLGLLSAWHAPEGALISNDEVAAVVTYIRSSWGNHGTAISPREVDDLRSAPLN